jgi:RNA polymerase sigma-70 factor, ECF subfamily
MLANRPPPAPRLVRAAPEGLAGRSDDELMTLSQAGLKAAFEVLVTRHAERIVNACARFVNDGAVAAELAQETWVAAWVARERYRGDGRFVVWLITMARNRCRNYLRDRRASEVTRPDAGRSEGAAPDTPRSPDQVDQLILEERRRRVRQALARLPERMREALLLRYGEDLRYDEMTAVLGTGESTLRSRVHKGLRLLRAAIERNR